MTQALTDVTSLVDAAFAECECIIANSGEHGGDNKAAYAVWHDCNSGFVCRKHFNDFLAHLPYRGPLRCTTCNTRFDDPVPDFIEMYPL